MPNDLGAGRGDLRRQRSRPAPEIDDPLAWPRRQQLDHAGAQLGDDPERLVIEPGVPASFGEMITLVLASHPDTLPPRHPSSSSPITLVSVQ